jgi:hypothetical protein
MYYQGAREQLNICMLTDQFPPDLGGVSVSSYVYNLFQIPTLSCLIYLYLILSSLYLAAISPVPSVEPASIITCSQRG